MSIIKVRSPIITFSNWRHLLIFLRVQKANPFQKGYPHGIFNVKIKGIKLLYPSFFPSTLYAAILSRKESREGTKECLHWQHSQNVQANFFMSWTFFRPMPYSNFLLKTDIFLTPKPWFFERARSKRWWLLRKNKTSISTKGPLSFCTRLQNRITKMLTNDGNLP